ncbi:MAG: hypothetical protein ACE5J5_06675 [Candidatus Hydrothermarchaeales archaeon]
MGENKVFKIENITIECNALCPFFFCGSEKCKLKEHVKKYLRLTREGYTVSMF